MSSAQQPTDKLLPDLNIPALRKLPIGAVVVAKIPKEVDHQRLAAILQARCYNTHDAFWRVRMIFPPKLPPTQVVITKVRPRRIGEKRKDNE